MTARRVLIVGGGYAGLYTAMGLQRRLAEQVGAGEVVVTVVDPRSYMTYQPFLPEAAAGSLEPRHVVVPLRDVLRRCEVLTGSLVELRHDDRVARIAPVHGEPYDLDYDQVVLTVGSVARTLPIPGLAEHGIGFKTIEEAIYLRNQVLHCLDVAQSAPEDEQRRRRALTFVFVGGGYAGIEAFAELQDMALDACRSYPGVSPADLRFVLVEAAGRILPEVDLDMAEYTLAQLRRRGMDVRLETRLESCEGGVARLSDGDALPTDTLVWTAGVKAHPVLARTGLPLDDRGRVVCTDELRVDGVPDAWAAGDGAAVPDRTRPGQTCGPSAQHAVRQASRLAANVAAHLTSGSTEPYEHAYAGSVASLGLYRGVAQVYGIKLRGPVAWFMHRTYHLSRVPTLSRKARVVSDWTLALFFRRQAVSLGSLARPFQEFRETSASG